MALSGDRGLTGDEIQYELLGRNLAQGNGYTLSVGPVYEPTALREPGYPFFIAFIYSVFGSKPVYVYVVQMFLFAFSCVLLFNISNKIFGVQIARYSAFLMAVCPTLSSYAVILYSESFSVFLLCLTVYLAFMAKVTGKLILFVVLGFVLGLLVLTKCVFIFFSFLIVAFFFIDYKKNVCIRRCAFNVGVSGCVFIAMLIPWFLRNNSLFGITNLTSRGEIVLLSRALRTDYPLEKVKAAYLYYMSEYLGSKLFPGIVGKPRDFMIMDDHRVFAIENELLDKGYSKKDISMMLRYMALSKIKTHPFKYILFTPLEFLKMIGFMHVPFLSESYGVAEFKTMIPSAIVLVIVKGALKSVGYILVVFSLIGIYLTIKRWRCHFLIFSSIIYVNLVYSLLNGYPRFSVPLVPFYIVYAVIAVVTVIKKSDIIAGIYE